MRCFIGIPIENGLKSKIKKLQEKLETTRADIKFVERENLHFTVKFLGDVPEEKISKIKEIMEKTATLFEPFEIYIKGLGCFPNKNYARVIWLSADAQLPALLEAFDINLSELGFKRESSYIPHLTIGRVKSGRNDPSLLKLLRELEKIEIGTMIVKDIKLFKSTLTPNGPIYEELFRVTLKFT